MTWMISQLVRQQQTMTRETKTATDVRTTARQQNEKTNERDRRYYVAKTTEFVTYSHVLNLSTRYKKQKNTL